MTYIQAFRRDIAIPARVYCNRYATAERIDEAPKKGGVYFFGEIL